MNGKKEKTPHDISTDGKKKKSTENPTPFRNKKTLKLRVEGLFSI